MKNQKHLGLKIGLSAAVILAVACGNGEAATSNVTTSETKQPESQDARNVAKSQSLPGSSSALSSTKIDSGGEVISQPKTPANQPLYSNSSVMGSQSLLQLGNSQTGIWVSGEGSIDLKPDLTLLNIRVETISETVKQARAEAASAMGSIVSEVESYGIAGTDIQTRSFDIWPRYEYPEITEKGQRVRKQVLVGYTVSNSAVMKVRDMEKIGTIIDGVAEAGGDATRIDGIQFTVEDPKPFMTGLRELAVQDAIAKARQFATLTGVEVGPLVFIAETTGGSSQVRNFADEAFGMKSLASAPPSPISGGELQLSLSIQAVFEIR